MVPLTGNTEAVVNAMVVTAVVIWFAFVSALFIVSTTEVTLFPIFGR